MQRLRVQRWWADRHVRRRPDRLRLTGGQWAGTAGFACTAVVIAVGVGPVDEPSPISAERVAVARDAFRRLAVISARPPHDTGYQREAFGLAWSDASASSGGGNGCDTRNDILARDLAVRERTAAATCAWAVASGTLTSPYTGRQVSFERGASSSAVQIDHIVALAYAWDLGARQWPTQRRVDFANDPANLVAVDGSSNQAKSDAEPARWMPPLRAFHCQYAVQFILILDRYRLPIDQPSYAVIDRVLDDC